MAPDPAGTILDLSARAQAVRDDSATDADWLARLVDIVGSAVVEVREGASRESPPGRGLLQGTQIAAGLLLRASASATPAWCSRRS
jgi:hypothetical protein